MGVALFQESWGGRGLLELLGAGEDISTEAPGLLGPKLYPTLGGFSRFRSKTLWLEVGMGAS